MLDKLAHPGPAVDPATRVSILLIIRTLCQCLCRTELAHPGAVVDPATRVSTRRLQQLSLRHRTQPARACVRRR